ncbi:MAG: hypothetical protein A3C12_03265 [Candidatus Sungbacteria bacterium RIFCSPHIGHO2_02_FULL_49_20]|uniref:Response regulatory domain-containing protein n=1 Tax=Candidatus Sungbacteria bacterium RIFCSPHIGHO2_02_FULL_49_20 TaxID=1802272 RepID=A0A1G2KQS1_9BACT|nr:MAG: hypothetical protein A3C12_03265 [Candidatus Sungbacteria bacterium RIFCSPHIGHO2_02_FULL_49_20]
MKKVLVIEDELNLCKSIEEILSAEGYTVVTASDGEEGLRLAVSETPDLVLLDLILPKKDGFSVLKELRENEATSKIPVIVLSNLGEMEDVGRVLELGANRYLVKTDYKLAEVVEKVKETLNKK